MAKIATTLVSKKQTLLPLLKTVSFILIFIFLLTITSNIFIPKQNIRENGINYFNARGFYGEPLNSLDIIAIGNSDLYSGFSPMILWRNHGFTSYSSGEARQTIAEAYKVLKAALTCQSPKLVILETDAIYEGGFTPMRINLSLSTLAQNTFPVVEFHSRWKSLAYQDFSERPIYTWKSKSKGFGISNKIDSYTGEEYMIPTNAKEPIKPFTVSSLNKFVELCNEKGIALILVEMPSADSWNYARHNAVNDFAIQHSIPFLDLNIDRDTFAFDWLTDTRDKGNHMNCSGAEKVTTYIGEYISENYSIPDHRNNEEYSIAWNQALEDYNDKVLIT